MESINFTRQGETIAANQRWTEFFREARRLAALSRARRAARPKPTDTSDTVEKAI